MEERAILKRGLADISELFVTHAAETAEVAAPAAVARPKARPAVVVDGAAACRDAPPAAGMMAAPPAPPVEVTGLACDPGLDARLDWLPAFGRGLLLTGAPVTLVVEGPAAESKAAGNGGALAQPSAPQEHPRLRFLSTGPLNLARLTGPTAPAAAAPPATGNPKHMFCYWIGEAGAQNMGRALEWCDRLVVALPPELPAFLRLYRFLKRLGSLRRQRVYYYLVASRHARVVPLRKIDEAWQAIAGRFLNVAVHCLGQIAPTGIGTNDTDAVGGPPAVAFDPLWTGLRHLITGSDALITPPPWRDGFLAWAAEQPGENGRGRPAGGGPAHETSGPTEPAAAAVDSPAGEDGADGREAADCGPPRAAPAAAESTAASVTE